MPLVLVILLSKFKIDRHRRVAVYWNGLLPVPELTASLVVRHLGLNKHFSID